MASKRDKAASPCIKPAATEMHFGFEITMYVMNTKRLASVYKVGGDSLINTYRTIWAVISIGYLTLLVGLAFLGSQIVKEVKYQKAKIHELYIPRQYYSP